MSSSDRAVEALIRDFASQLQDLIRAQLSTDVTDAIQTALGGALAGRGAGARNGAARGRRADKGGKRSAEQIEKLAAQLHAYIDKNPDQRAEQIAQASKLTTGELVVPIRRLLAEKKIKAKGKARGTTYNSVK